MYHRICVLPLLRICCLCIPRKLGLLGMGYVKVALNIALLVVTLASVWTIRSNSSDFVILLVVNVLGIPFIIVDVFINALVIYACHKKGPAMLHVFYRYCLVMLVIAILWATALIALKIFSNSEFEFSIGLSDNIIYLAILVLGIISRIHIIIHVINERKKLESSGQFQSTNDMDEACAARVEDQPPPIVEVK